MYTYEVRIKAKGCFRDVKINILDADAAKFEMKLEDLGYSFQRRSYKDALSVEDAVSEIEQKERQLQASVSDRILTGC